MLETELILWSVEVWLSKCVYQPMKRVLPRSDSKKQLLFLKLSPNTDKRLNDHKSTNPTTTKQLSLAYVKIEDQILNLFCILQFLTTFIINTAKNTVIWLDFLVLIFWGKAQFRIVLDNLRETMRKLCISTKFFTPGN